MILPKYVNKHTTRHGKTLYYFRRNKGDRVPLPGEPGSEEFDSAYISVLRDYTPINKFSTMTPARMRGNVHQRRLVEMTLAKSISGAKVRAAKKGLGFDIDIDWLLERAEKNGFCCELTGIEFFCGRFGLPIHRAFSPSLDRIDNRLGYVKNNVRIVLLAVNVMLSDWGPKVFEMIALNYAEVNAPDIGKKYRGGRPPAPNPRATAQLINGSS